MSQKNKLPSNREIERVVSKLRDLGVEVGSVDVRVDGIMVSPPTHTLIPAGNTKSDVDEFFAQHGL